MQYLVNDVVNAHLLLAALLGGLIGLEREFAGKDPSIRTFTLISLGSCVFSLISVDAAVVPGIAIPGAGIPGSAQNVMQGAAGAMNAVTANSMSLFRADPGRIAAQIVTGVGFLGAGTIFRSANRILGLTTATLMWVTAAIGMAVGFNRIDLAVSATFISLFVTIVLRVVHKMTNALKKNGEDAHI